MKRICEKITKHRYRQLQYHTLDEVDRDREYYYRCRICGELFWNYTPPTVKDLKGVGWYDEKG